MARLPIVKRTTSTGNMTHGCVHGTGTLRQCHRRKRRPSRSAKCALGHGPVWHHRGQRTRHDRPCRRGTDVHLRATVRRVPCAVARSLVARKRVAGLRADILHRHTAIHPAHLAPVLVACRAGWSGLRASLASADHAGSDMGNRLPRRVHVARRAALSNTLIGELAQLPAPCSGWRFPWSAASYHG